MNRYGNYTVADVAQILRVTNATVLSYINKKKLKALGGEEKVERGKRRHLQIRRDDLIDYLTMHRGEYDSDLLRAFGINLAEEDEIPDEVKSYYRGGTKHKVDETAAYEAHDISELKGAWAPENLQTVDEVTKRNPDYIYSVLIDGRIAVANVECRTALAVATALMDDKKCGFSRVEIKRDPVEQ